MAVSLANLRAANEKRWAAAKLTRPFNTAAERLLAAKSRYQAVEAKTGVPWFVIAVIHERESSQLWSASLAQCDPWNRVSTHVPKGRGPFNSWEEAAIDALVNCAPYAARNEDWSVGGTLLMLEQYNGLGYAAKGVSSPYLWAGTDQYAAGKYVKDGVYDTTAVDKQLGCAGMIKALMTMDGNIRFVTTGAPAKPKDSPAATADPPSAIPASTVQPPSAWAAFFMAIKTIFGRK